MSKQNLLALIIGALLFFSNNTMAGGSDPDRNFIRPEIMNYNDFVRSINYPLPFLKQGVEGKVLVYIKVDAKGNVDSYRVLEYSHAQLKMEVKKNISRLKFYLAMDNNFNARSASVTVPIRFELKS